MPLVVKLTLVTNNFLDVVVELIVEKIVAPGPRLQNYWSSLLIHQLLIYGWRLINF
jgi:hypothetical protein